MKTIKPQALGVLTRCFEHQHSFRLGISALAFVPLSSEPCLLPEVDMWKLAAEALGPRAALDVGIPKSRGEYLVTARAHPPHGRPTTCHPVRARVGGLDKVLQVFGDRRWRGRAPSHPAPFQQIPLDWDHAFGGKGYPRNPRGKGCGAASLPNVEYPKQRVVTPNDRPEPASFGPIDIGWPQRHELAGTYDARWLQQHYPGFAKDIDWRIFNLAPRDQQRESSWTGDEPYRFENMHPSRPALEGQLPGLRARSFVTQQRGEALEFAEVPLRLTTLWFFPEAERAVLVFQGSVRVREDDASDVLHLVMAAERLEHPKPLEHYTRVLEQRLDKNDGALHALRDEELLPAALFDPTHEEHPGEHPIPTASEGLLQQNLQRNAVAEHHEARETLASMGLDPDAHEPVEPEPLCGSLDLDEGPRSADRSEAGVQEQGPLGKELAARDPGAHPFEPTPGTTLGAPGGFLGELVDDGKRAGGEVGAVAALLADPTIKARIEQADARMQDLWQAMEEPDEREAELVREADQDPEPRLRLERALAAKESLDGVDLSGADLRDMDLRGADLRGVILERVRLDGSDLRQADLSKALLVGASLDRARLDHARLTDANLRGASLVEASLRSADLGHAVLAEADLERADFCAAKLEGVDLRKARFAQTKAQHIEANKLIVVECDLRGIDLSHATLVRANFIEVDLSHAKLSHADLTSASFVDCSARATDFTGATLDNARFVLQCRLSTASFVGAQLHKANLRGCDLTRADFRDAVLDGSDLSECALQGAQFYRASAKELKLNKADLSEASMFCVNLMQASFAGATIEGMDLRASNLYGADMARVRTDSRVQLDSSCLTKVRIHPKYRQQSPS
ncbi:MAG: pentapeptide repeat-containing protein [Deltaproteobacteria bacterium]|nr:pentapeptide repeat-containing protein [Deltaproteobacteria bacterium]